MKIEPSKKLAVVKSKLRGSSDREAARNAGVSAPSVASIMQEYESQPELYQVGLLTESIASQREKLKSLQAEAEGVQKRLAEDEAALLEAKKESENLDFLSEGAEEKHKDLQGKAEFIEKRISALKAKLGSYGVQQANLETLIDRGKVQIEIYNVLPEAREVQELYQKLSDKVGKLSADLNEVYASAEEVRGMNKQMMPPDRINLVLVQKYFSPHCNWNLGRESWKDFDFVKYLQEHMPDLKGAE